MKRVKGSNEETLHNPKRKFKNRYDSGSQEDDPSQLKSTFSSGVPHPITPDKLSETFQNPEAVKSTDQTLENTDGNDLSENRIPDEGVKQNDGSEAEVVKGCDNEKETLHSGIEDTDEDCSKDNESRCSESDPGDKSYRINVGLYGTDFDEDSTRDEGASFIFPSNKYPDLNNNQPRGQQIGFEGIEPSKQISVVAGQHDERSNTVDGSTRRALESQCLIYESQNSRSNQDSTIQPNAHKGSQSRYGQENVSSVMAEYKVKENDPSYSKSIAEALRQALAEDTVKRTTPSLIGQSYGSYYQHSQHDQYNKVRTPNVLSHCFGAALISSSMTSQNNQFNKVCIPNHQKSQFSAIARCSTMMSQTPQYSKVSSPNLLSPRFGVALRSSTMTSPLNVDANIAAEEIATELVQTYSGKNSHMITDILRRKTGGHYHNNNLTGGQYTGNNLTSGGEYTGDNLTIADKRQYEHLPATETLHDVDLLNTPQQLTPVDQESPSNQCYIQADDYPAGNYSNHNALSTPEPFHHNTTAHFQGKMTCNDVQVYGSKWSAKLRTQSQEGYMEGCSENPFPRPHYTVNESPSAYINRFPMQEGASLTSTLSTVKVPTTFDYRQFNLDTHLQKLQSPPPVYAKGHSSYQLDCGYPLSPDPLGLVGMVGSCPRPSHEVTQMTYTPKEMMESHLSGNIQRHRSSKTATQSNIPGTEFSSIYPPKEYIDHPFKISSDNSDTIHTNRPKPLKKRFRPSKYDQLPFRSPTVLPADEIISKYPLPPETHTEPFGVKHKYIVNPSNLKEISPKTLITKYIDYLIMENEQITDISQSPGAPEDIYVTEDMDFMESLKRRGQFPSKKFRDWVRNFYPRLDFERIKFKDQSSVQHSNNREVQVDSRPTQQILEDTFYFFQRSLMNFKDASIS